MNFIFQLSNDEYIKRVSIANPNAEIVSEYTGMRNKVRRICKVCGDDRYVKAQTLLNGKGCPVCAARKRIVYHQKTHEQFVAKMQEVNPNIEIMSRYHKSCEKVKCKCLIDGHVWDTLPSGLLRGHGCPVCANKMQHRRSNDEFVNEMKQRYPNIIIMSEFTKVADKVRCKCTVCEHEFETTPNHLIDARSKGCPYCSRHGRVTEEEFIKRLRCINEDVEYIDGYYKLKTRAHVKCKICGYEWKPIAENLLLGTGCPNCKMSHGARRVEKYLQKHKIQYISEYRFEDCFYKRVLPFDFYLPELNICIEYDGIQHFQPVKYSSESVEEADQKYRGVVLRDNIKNQYCHDNGIKLIRIPYTEYDEIEEKLDKLLA